MKICLFISPSVGAYEERTSTFLNYNLEFQVEKDRAMSSIKNWYPAFSFQQIKSV
jgi:hypothetical protein